MFCDFVLRLLVIEKHVALEWIQAGVDIPGFEAPGYTPSPTTPEGKSGENSISEAAPIPLSSGRAADDINEPPSGPPSPWEPLLHMITSPRPVTNFILTILNGIVLGGVLGTQCPVFSEDRSDPPTFQIRG